ncbi:hypothetical protein E1176_04575, partial [Fulvivirga sp. RKSG066]|uniref:Calx-beta domain-containing protein n=1 Tax=Fulvivirga aurantia TaxID=2529383 RepID=UPI0012BBCF4C
FGLPENQPGSISVDYSVTGTGVDFTGTATIPDGEQKAKFWVIVPENNTLNTDTVDLTLTLTNASVGIKDDPAFNSHELELIDDIKNVKIANDTVDIDETAGIIQIPVTVSNPLDSELTVDYSITGDADAGVDYELVSSNPLIIEEDSTSGYISFRILDDLSEEDTESISITLDAITTADASDTETILLAGAANRNIVYDLSDDSKLIGFVRSNEDTLMIDAAGTYTAELEVSGGTLQNSALVTFDDSELPAGVDDNNTLNTISFGTSETSRTISFTVEASAISDTEDQIFEYSIFSIDGNGDAEVKAATNSALVIKILKSEN